MKSFSKELSSEADAVAGAAADDGVVGVAFGSATAKLVVLLSKCGRSAQEAGRVWAVVHITAFRFTVPIQGCCESASAATTTRHSPEHSQQWGWMSTRPRSKLWLEPYWVPICWLITLKAYGLFTDRHSQFLESIRQNKLTNDSFSMWE